ncbi:MAG: hypothetical protein AAGI52_15155 [Bacteroidota bacterium]
MRYVLLLLAALALTPTSSAQDPVSPGYVGAVPTNSPNHFFYARAGELTKRVSVWGTVRASGTYFVRQNVDLVELLSLAGGPSLNARAEDNERIVTIRVYRLEGDQRILAYEETLVDMIADPAAYPEILDNDVVEVETVEDRRWTFRDTVTVISAVSTTVLALERIYSLTRDLRGGN